MPTRGLRGEEYGVTLARHAAAALERIARLGRDGGDPAV
jgi:hypothetical protein